ncbi:hypothetical protein CYMTET_48024 [Cymbomonas tetramitiformis]|uniref:Uncharacterized protein n=1 Tax=Cymbomonas tetramitiformis TaxID=36881 RepID=A0AAE0BT53_9CHLO|nr:hypothetical protein CYMTET_48024 [Cymbomonas tetramitiformis]
MTRITIDRAGELVQTILQQANEAAITDAQMPIEFVGGDRGDKPSELLLTRTHRRLRNAALGDRQGKLPVGPGVVAHILIDHLAHSKPHKMEHRDTDEPATPSWTDPTQPEYLRKAQRPRIESIEPMTISREGYSKAVYELNNNKAP